MYVRSQTIWENYCWILNIRRKFSCISARRSIRNVTYNQENVSTRVISVLPGCEQQQLYICTKLPSCNARTHQSTIHHRSLTAETSNGWREKILYIHTTTVARYFLCINCVAVDRYAQFVVVCLRLSSAVAMANLCSKVVRQLIRLVIKSHTTHTHLCNELQLRNVNCRSIGLFSVLVFEEMDSYTVQCGC